jgi:hypothetical protein
MAKHYAIFLSLAGQLPVEAIQRKLDNLTQDWLRFGVGQYMVLFEGQADGLYDQIRPLVPAETNTFVVEINLKNRKGWMQKLAVDWVVRHSSS